jgi:hypothetical protein
MEEAGIITRCISSWGSKTKFVPKPGNQVLRRLRMMHQYIQLNTCTVKMNYPMGRIEPILNMVGQAKWKVFFKVDTVNGYWAVPLDPAHAYKTAFNSILGQFCY